jgi:hypothetical protein
MKTIRVKEDQNFWNFVFSTFFIVVLILATVVVHQAKGYPIAVPWFDAIMMAFATLRITRLVVYDKIARWFRELFVCRRVYIEDGVEVVEITPRKSGFMRTISDLLACPWCIGVWAALIVAFCYFMFPWAWFIEFFLALAGAGSVLQVAANGIGWRAEHLKKTTEQL